MHHRNKMRSRFLKYVLSKIFRKQERKKLRTQENYVQETILQKIIICQSIVCEILNKIVKLLLKMLNKMHFVCVSS